MGEGPKLIIMSAKHIRKNLAVPYILLDARDIVSDGAFKFINLGKGEYVIALLADGEMIGPNTPVENITAGRNPGVIRLNKKGPVMNVGMINIIVN